MWLKFRKWCGLRRVIHTNKFLTFRLLFPPVPTTTLPGWSMTTWVWHPSPTTWTACSSTGSFSGSGWRGLSRDTPHHSLAAKSRFFQITVNSDLIYSYFFLLFFSLCNWDHQATGDEEHISTVQSLRERRLWWGERIFFVPMLFGEIIWNRDSYCVQMDLVILHFSALRCVLVRSERRGKCTPARSLRRKGSRSGKASPWRWTRSRSWRRSTADLS